MREQTVRPPGPRGVPVLGVLPRIWRDPLRFFQQVAYEHGGVARFGVGSFQLYLLSRPEPIEYVLTDPKGNYWKGAGLEATRPVMGDGLATSDGEHWRRQRRLMNPAFSRARLLERVPSIVASIEAHLAGWEAHAASGRPFDLAADMSRLTQRVIFRALFGADVDQDVDALGAALVEANDYINHAAWSFVSLPAAVPTPRRLRFRRAVATLDRLVHGLIAKGRARAAQDEPETLLDRLLAARDDAGAGMSDQALRDELMTLFVAGHDATAAALAWTFHLLGQHPDARARLEAEVDGVLGPGRDGRPPAAADLEGLEWTRWSCLESLRLYPPGWIIVRTPREADEVGGYPVPAAATLLISQYVVHRHPDLWEAPEAFDPARWAPERARGRPRFSFFPYGGGKRLCIGKPLAELVLELALLAVARRFRLEPASGRAVVPQPLTVLRPKGGLSMIARRR